MRKRLEMERIGENLWEIPSYKGGYAFVKEVSVREGQQGRIAKPQKKQQQLGAPLKYAKGQFRGKR